MNSKEAIKRLRTKKYHWEMELFQDLIDCVESQQEQIDDLQSTVNQLMQNNNILKQ